MIDSSSTVMFLDTRDEVAKRIPLSSLFRKYAIYTKSPMKGISVLDFDSFKRENQKFMVNDWNGYTEIHYIVTHNSVSIGKWYKLKTDYGNEILITGNTQIPVYDPETSKVGFHGEVKYKFDLKWADQVSGKFWVREYDIDVDTEHPVLFGQAECTYDPKINCTGCMLSTKSGHCTINNIDFVTTTNEMADGRLWK